MAMTREERLAKLQEQRDKLNRKIASINAREQAQKRKEDTRRKVLIGAAMQAAVKRGEWSEEALRKLLDAGITTKRDREFLGLDKPSKPIGLEAAEPRRGLRVPGEP
jgi:hypothetical protein